MEPNKEPTMKKVEVICEKIEIEKIVKTSNKVYVIYKEYAERRVSVFNSIEEFAKEISDFKGYLDVVLGTYSIYHYRWKEEAIELLEELETQSINEGLEDLVIVRVPVHYHCEDFLVSETLLFKKVRERIYEKLKEKMGELIDHVQDIIDKKLENTIRAEKFGAYQPSIGFIEHFVVSSVEEIVKEKIQQ